MMKRLLFLAIATCGILLAHAQRTLYAWDFNDGVIPSDFSLYDVDQNTPSSGAKELGFAVGKPWIVTYVLLDDNDLSLLSTSRYVPEGTSNDWLVTPALQLDGSGLFFLWDACNVSPAKDGYVVLLSTQGNRPEDFAKADTLYAAPAGEEVVGDIFTHAVPLDKYAGRTVHIAIVNNSTNKSFLMIDNLKVEELVPTISLRNTSVNVLQPTSTTCEISADIFNDGLVDFGLCDVSLRLSFTGRSNTYNSVVKDVYLRPGSMKSIKFENIPVVPDAGSSLDYTLTASYVLPGQTEQRTATLSSTLCRVETVYPHRVVWEEGTGTWCPMCPRGTVMLDGLQAQFPDTFIGISVHNEDPMTVDTYDTALTNYIEGFPQALVNRNFISDLDDLTSCAYQHQLIASQAPVASLQVAQARFNADSTKLDVQLKSRFGFSTTRGSTYRFSLVLTEDGVCVDADGYQQNNAYAGAEEPMGGYESLPPVIPAADMRYDHVARYLSDAFTGIEGSVPQTIDKDQDVVFDFSIPLPRTILHKRNLSVIGMLLDVQTGEICNADCYAFNPTSIRTVAAEGLSVRFVPSVEGLTVRLDRPATEPVGIQLMRTDGILVSSATLPAGTDACLLSAPARQGAYLVRLSTREGAQVQKVVF